MKDEDGSTKQGSLDAPDRRSTGRYLDLVKSLPDPWRLRRAMVACARKHGVEAAVREFGAGVTTVRRWLRRAEVGPWKKPGAAKWYLTPAEVERIVRAKLARPDLGTLRLKKEFGLPHGTRQITRVIREHGLSRPWHRHDLEFEIRSDERRVGLAEMYLALGKLEEAYGMETPRSWSPLATMRRILKLELALSKKRARLAGRVEKKARKKGGGG